MRPVSDALLSTVRGSHGMAVRARVVTSFQTGTDPDGVEIEVISGTVNMDATANVRSTLDLVTAPSRWPRSPSDLLAPYGNEIFVERGVRLAGGSVEWVSLGYFRVDEPDQDEVPRGAVRVAGSDRMAGIVDGRLTAPKQFSAVATFGDVLEELVTDIYPDAIIEWDDSTSGQHLGRSVVAEDDRFGFLDDLVKSVGKIWYWDHRGVLVVKSPPDTRNPVFDVTSGEGGVLVTLSRNLSRRSVYNGVVATGEAGDTNQPARALVVDTNPRSPTRWGGPFGKVPQFFSSPLITSNVQATSAAASLLRTSIGVPYNVDFSMVPNPALEPLDPVRVSEPGVDRIHVIEKLTLPLVAEEPVRGSTREQTFVSIGGVT